VYTGFTIVALSKLPEPLDDHRDVEGVKVAPFVSVMVALPKT
jgi:hypothetical protein